MRLIFSIFRYIGKTIAVLFLVYAVIFSVVCTTGLVMGYYYIMKPVRSVQALKDHNPNATRFMAMRWQQMQLKKNPDTLIHSFVPLDSISPYLVKSVLAAEDDGFYQHPGIDIAAVLRAIESNKEKNRFQSGASTITQQLAKNLFTNGEKTFGRKYQELMYTLLMESILGKNRILELYLNYAQWGPTIFGCDAAAWEYYNKSCKSLTLEQSARLAAILAKPEKLRPNSRNSVFLSKRLSGIADNLYRRHTISDSLFYELGGSDSLRQVLASRRQNSSYSAVDTLF